MTNEHEQPLPNQELHEQLCAYVLGECTNEERAEIERELLRSPELRAQRERIERTVGLVQSALGEGESLSSEAAETLRSAASSSRPSAWKGSAMLRLAAGIGAVALGYAIVRESTVMRETDVATLDERGRSLPRGELEKTVDSREVARSLDAYEQVTKPKERFDAQAKNEPAPAAVTASSMPQADPVDSVMPPASRGSNVRKDSNVADAESVKLLKAEELVTRQRDFDRGFAEGDVSAKRDQSAGVHVIQEAQVPVAPGQPEAKDGTTAGRTLGSTGYGGSTATGAGARGESKKQPAGAARPTGYRGPGDSTPPSGPATGGPSTPGLASGGKDGDVSAFKMSRAKGGAGGAAPSTSPPPPPAERLAVLDNVTLGADLRASGEKSKAAAGDDKQILYFARLEDGDTGGVPFSPLADWGESEPYYKLTPAEQQMYLERRCRLILEHCARRPNEKPRDMFFRFWGDNPFEVTALDAQSTFGADVDTASYALARRYLNEGNLPEKAQIRTEEFVNYFKSDVAAPTSGVFAIHTDLAPSRYSTDSTRQMLRVVVRGKDLSKVERPRMNLTFVVDVSGSMREQMRLEMVKTSIRLLVTQLDPYDKIGIVKFSTDASVVLPLTSVSEREKIELAISPLQPDGSTNSNAGLELGYGMAVGGFDKEATNRVVFLSDGVANVGETDPAKIAERVKPMRQKGIYLNTIGVGMNNHNDVLLEQLADKADGMCSYIDTADEAKKQLVDNFSGAFQPIARDVKIQVEFDPTQVLRYRLLGYENRAIADADFRNDKVDAGDLGAGHQVTALYEIERQGGASSEKPLATVHLRWKEPRNFGLNPESDAASEISQIVAAGPVSTFEGAGQSYRKAVMAAQFAEILRRSVHARGDSLDGLLNDALKLQGEIPNDTDFKEFVTLVSKSKDLIVRTMPACDELCQAIDAVRESQYRRAQIETIQKELDQKTLADLKQQNDILEARLRELVQRRLENRVR